MIAFANFYFDFLISFFIFKVSCELFDSWLDAYLDYKEIRQRHKRHKKLFTKGGW